MGNDKQVFVVRKVYFHETTLNKMTQWNHFCVVLFIFPLDRNHTVPPYALQPIMTKCDFKGGNVYTYIILFII